MPRNEASLESDDLVSTSICRERRFYFPEEYEGSIGAVTGENIEGMSGEVRDEKTYPKDELVLEIPMASWNVKRRAS